MRKAVLANPQVAKMTAWAIDGALRLIAATIRWQITGQSNLAAAAQGDTPVILCLWHGRLAMVSQIWSVAGPLRAYTPAFVVSHSRDGGIGAHIARLHRIALIRGSGSRAASANNGAGGRRALETLVAMIAHLTGKSILGLTPDGPRGPAEQAGPGVATLAERTGAVIVPVAWSARRASRLGSWDRFMLPWPFTRGAICFGPPIMPVAASRNAGGPTIGPETRAERTVAISAAIAEVTRAADALCGRPA